MRHSRGMGRALDVYSWRWKSVAPLALDQCMRPSQVNLSVRRQVWNQVWQAVTRVRSSIQGLLGEL